MANIGAPSSQDKSVELCGVSTADGVLIVQHTLPTAEHAAAAPAPDAGDGSDSVFDAGSDAPVPLVPHDCNSDFGSEPDVADEADRELTPVVHDDLETAMHAYEGPLQRHCPYILGHDTPLVYSVCVARLVSRAEFH